MNFTDDFYMGNGYICYSEELERVYTELDDVFKGFLNGMEYKNYNIPALIDGEVLEKCGYFESFPNQITPVGSFKEEAAEEIMNKKKMDESCISLRNMYLTPSACLHIYPMYRGKTIEKEQIVTTRARVYRCENSEIEKLTRLWDFSVREIVFIGSDEFVKEHLEFMKKKAIEFAKKITEQATLSVAHDHFYKSQRNSIKAMVQTRNEQKFELRIPIKDREVSVASFNFHGFHFSKPFKFDQSNKIVSGCVGFGMERWVAACMEYEKLHIRELNSK